MKGYYNEIEPYAARWLHNLMDAGEIAPGTVDERSILDVTPEDLAGYDRCHFFAGIAGWDYALRLAGWPEDIPVWTGSCPCQPFSSAGRGGGGSDERHLWPAWFWLIRQCRPSIIFGEQVASKGGLAWLDVVFSDLEAAGYTCGASILCAFQSYHRRQRIFFVAYSSDIRFENLEKYNTMSAKSYCISRDGEWYKCQDGKMRFIKSEFQPLAYGVPARVGRLRAYGNAIVPQVAAVFIKAVMDCHG